MCRNHVSCVMASCKTRTFLIGEVGVVTWLVGLVGDDTPTVVGVGVVLLLTAAEGLFLSKGVET